MKSGFLSILLLISLGSISQVSLVPTANDHFISSLVMHGDTLVIKASDTYLAKSYDLGSTVQVIPNNLPVEVWFSDFPIVDDVYYLRAQQLGPTNGAVLRSENYGVTWDTLYHTNGYFGSLAVFDSTRMLMGGIGGGEFSVLTPAIGYWYNYSPFTSGTFKDAAYLNKDTCFLLGSNFSGISFNGGLSWSNSFPNGSLFEKVQFVGGDTIYAGGGSTGLEFEYSYTLGAGGGGNILYDDQGYSIRILDMWFENSKHGYLFGSSRIFPQPYNKCAIFETFDRGLTWTQHQLDFDGVIATAVKANDSIIFLGGGTPWDESLVLKWNINEPFQTLGVEFHPEKARVNIYPNPTKSEVFITSPFDMTGHEKIQIFDLSGKLVKDMPFENHVNIDGLEAGVYVLTIRDKQRRIGQQKLIVD